MTHLLAEQFQMHAAIQLIHVPYKGGGPALNDVLAGHIPVYFDTLTTSASLVQANKLRALAVVSPKRSPAIPNVPTLAEAGYPEVQGMAWFAIVGPPGMRREVVARLNEEAVKALRVPEIRDRIVGLGGTVEGGTPEELGNFIKGDVAKLEPIIREARITTD